MRLLLDTHALIWLVHAPERLSSTARVALTAEGSAVYASHVSLWEMAIKRSAGKLDVLDRRAAEWFDHYVTRSGLRTLPISATHIGAVEDLPKLHNDPFDRLLIAQASATGMAIVSADSSITRYETEVVW